VTVNTELWRPGNELRLEVRQVELFSPSHCSVRGITHEVLGELAIANIKDILGIGEELAQC